MTDLNKQRLEEANKKRELARKTKNAKKRALKKRSIKSLKKACDSLWGKIIRGRSGACEYCGLTDERQLNAHHIFPRGRLATRYDLDNGICLCINHHTFSKDFSAHVTGLEFAEWITNRKGDDWYENMVTKSRGYCSLGIKDFKEIESELKTILKQIEEK